MPANRRHCRARVIAVAVLAAVAAALLSPRALAQRSSLEYAVKATFLYKFASFVEWPAEVFESPTSPLVICLVGSDAVSRLVDDAARGQMLGARPISVRRVADAAGTRDCHVLYVASGHEDTDAGDVDKARGTPVLTVTDRAREDRAGIVNFVIADNRVRFEIDLEAAEQNRLVISSKLLSLAARVRSRPPRATYSPESP